MVIRGATPHFDLVVGECTCGIARIAAEGKMAVGFGVLACETIEQAIERAGSKAGNRGFDAAMVAIEMANLLRRPALRPGISRTRDGGTSTMASPRRQGREVALQILCAVDAQTAPDAPAALDVYFSHLAAGADEEDMPAGEEPLDRAFVDTLVRATLEQPATTVDDAITQVSRSWRLDRMARVDRNILRLAVAEMLYLPEIPGRVSINEAVELAKRYGAAESPAFVNGLLDSAIKALEIRKYGGARRPAPALSVAAGTVTKRVAPPRRMRSTLGAPGAGLQGRDRLGGGAGPACGSPRG